ncbi:hypothetical protein ACF0H5_006223 [Mactra antiquata]
MDECQQRHSLLCFIFLHCVFLSLIQYSDADCSITTSGVHTFGSACKYMCHCKNGESCNKTTGQCTSGCAEYWFGPGCQYRDLAEKEFPRHASNLENTTHQYSDKGNDGNTSTCSYTKEASLSTKIPWWRVVLRNEVTITDIYILTTQDGLKYFPGFEVTVEKIPYDDKESHVKPSDTSVCYKHGNTVPDSTTIHVTCTTPLIGNQVRITLSKKESQLIVCDFRINQGRNIAFRQSVTSSAILSNHKTYYQASLAVDGLVSYAHWGECFVTGGLSNKWLQVEFDQLMDVYYFSITKLHNRDEYINNSKIYDTTRGKKMLFDSGSDNSPVTRGYLNENVQTLSIEKETGNHMAICELELYGDCPLHQCGYDCSKVCHCKTLTSLEDKISGICSSGCEGRWTGDDGKCDRGNCARNKWGTSCQNNCGACRREPCDFESGKCKGGCQDGYYNTDDCNTECDDGSYGYSCRNTCSKTCKNSCNKINGNCIDGCKPGYFGDKCEQECSAGKFGQDCRDTCSENCYPPCHHINGNCTSCYAGWKGNNCNTECDDGSYGYSCRNTCSKTCKNSCNKINGNCINGCKPGYMGYKCEQECQAGTFGQNCGNTCNTNCDVTCHHVSGTCSRCKAGWKGADCNTECDDGSYGYSCRNTCSKTCKNSCNKINGNCINGCKPGYNGYKCDQECQAGTFGQDCGNTCNTNCDVTCHHVSGTCSRCKAGWKGADCNTECDDGSYGYSCRNTCSKTCKNSCNKINGNCINGCKPGYMGYKCEQECSAGKFGQDCGNTCNANCDVTCHHVSGTCKRCKAGWKGASCDAECDEGSYGYYCRNSCSKNCKNGCVQTDGKCVDGCIPGYFGNKCEQECYRTFGQNCRNKCNANCNGTCHHVSGVCKSCKAGWRGANCDTECDDGSYGIGCSEKCSDKCLTNCDKVNGICSSCEAGWYGKFCENKCPHGRYGRNCHESCNRNCEGICNRVTGKCTQCKPGWKNEFCDQECDVGRYGHNCENSCSKTCKNSCNKINGNCIDGCVPGYLGDTCEQVCPAGKFGQLCRNTCHHNCDVTCNHMSGICAKCQAGWKGDYCDSECEDGSYGDYCKEHCGYCYKNTACDKINGTCIIGCDSGYEGSLCTSKIVQEPSPGQSLPVAAIAGVSSALVVVVVIIVAIVFIVTRRRSGFKKSENTEAIGGNETERNSVSDNAKKNVSDKSRRMRPSKHNETVYENTLGLFPQPDKSYDMQQQPTTSSACTKPSNVKEDVDKYNMFGNDPDCNKTAGAITLNELTQYVKSKLAKVDFFDNEFQDIPYGLQHPTLDATKPVNIGKNRYKDLYAYDHSRVVLKTLPSEPNSDYINATHIKGYKKDRAYIAAQGPTETNKNEFWRMIWENNVNVIAMVTKLIEETKMKCVQYWATKGNRKTFGKVTVFTESEEEFAEYSIRHLKITYDGETRERNVIHYIYTAWPDKFIPNSTCSLLYFWQKVRKHDANKTNPWLVHCSAGVGRTGTFISIDYLYDQGIYAGFIDINTCVRQLRNQRVNMVQMKDQYRYLYRIMIEALILPSTPVSVYNFASYFGELLTVDKKTRRPRLKLEFELMSQTDCLVKDSETQEYTYKNAKLAANKTKNRYNNILAPDEYRPFLSTNVPGTTNYINAVYMPSYSDLFSYIIAQSPLPDTAVDCCRLIIEQDIHLVVTFEDVSDNEVGIYLPRKDSIKVGPFEATLNKEEIKDGYILRRHTLKFKSREHEVIQVVCQNWLIHEVVPEDPSKMLQILLDTRELQRQNENKPVMLQCLNGAERSGLFVVLMNIIERVCKEEEVSILLVVRYLRTRRQQIVPNYEQYKFCHDVLLSYIETNSTYANL